MSCIDVDVRRTSMDNLSKFHAAQVFWIKIHNISPHFSVLTIILYAEKIYKFLKLVGILSNYFEDLVIY